MMRFAARISMVTLYASLVSCGGGPHQPEPPATVPSPAVQPQMTQPSPSVPLPKADPKKVPNDTAAGNYPWQSGPIASR